MAFYLAAAQSIESGDMSAANTQLDSAIAHRKDFAVFHQSKGWVLTRLLQPDSAIASYKRSLDIKSHSPKVWAALGGLYQNSDRYREAILYLRKATDAYPDSAELRIALVDSYFRDKQYRRVLDGLAAYFRDFPAPHAPITYKLRGVSFLKLKSYAAARAELEYYCDLKYNDGEGWKSLGKALFYLDLHDEAVTALNRAQKLIPGDPEIFLYRSRYFQHVEKNDIAMEQITVGLSLNPANAELIAEKGILLYKNQNLEEAENLLKQALKIQENTWIAYRYLGFIAEAKKQPKEAIDYFSVYIKNASKDDREVRTRIEALGAGNGR